MIAVTILLIKVRKLIKLLFISKEIYYENSLKVTWKFWKEDWDVLLYWNPFCKKFLMKFCCKMTILFILIEYNNFDSSVYNLDFSKKMNKIDFHFVRNLIRKNFASNMEIWTEEMSYYIEIHFVRNFLRNSVVKWPFCLCWYKNI